MTGGAQERRGMYMDDRAHGATGGPGSLPRTPHLTSPLEGGRDELGKGMRVVGEGGVRQLYPSALTVRLLKRHWPSTLTSVSL